MPRRRRAGTAGLVFHVMNRAARRLTLFDGADDYDAFLRVLRDATDRLPMRLLCFTVMPNHWHMVLWPDGRDDLSTFMAWVTATHSRRWHLAHRSTGTGTLYQGRYKAVAVKDDGHFFTVCRYVERNAVRARLVSRAEQWRWSSASRPPHADRPPLHEWPVPRPPDWDRQVNSTESIFDLDDLRSAIRRSIPFGPASWSRATAERLGWPGGYADRGRPIGGGDGRK